MSRPLSLLLVVAACASPATRALPAPESESGGAADSRVDPGFGSAVSTAPGADESAASVVDGSATAPPAGSAVATTVPGSAGSVLDGPTCFPEWARAATLSVDVRSEGSRRFRLGEEERVQGSWDMRASFQLRSRLTADGAHLEQSRFSGWRGDPLAPIAYATLYVLHRIPGIRIDPDGAVIGIEGAARAKAAAEADFAGREGTPSGSMQSWELLSSEAGLRGQAAQWWQLFAFLSCRDLEGRTTSTEVSNDSVWLPGMHDVPVVIDTEVERVACPSGEPGCERRTVSLRPDADRTLAALRQQMSAQGVDGIERVAGFAIRRVASGVFEADDHPVELSLLKETTTVLRRPGDARTISQIDSDTSTYRFSARTGPRR